MSTENTASVTSKKLRDRAEQCMGVIKGIQRSISVANVNHVGDDCLRELDKLLIVAYEEMFKANEEWSESL